MLPSVALAILPIRISGSVEKNVFFSFFAGVMPGKFLGGLAMATKIEIFFNEPAEIEISEDRYGLVIEADNVKLFLTQKQAKQLRNYLSHYYTDEEAEELEKYLVP